MAEKDYTNSVPEQISDREINATSTAELTSITEAKKLFSLATDRVRDVNNWHTIAGRLFGLGLSKMIYQHNPKTHGCRVAPNI